MILCDMTDRCGTNARMTFLMGTVVTAVGNNPFKCRGWANKDVRNYFKPGVGVYLTNLMLRYILDEDRSVPVEIITWAMCLHAQADAANGGKTARTIAPGSSSFEVLEWLLDYMVDDVSVARIMT